MGYLRGDEESLRRERLERERQETAEHEDSLCARAAAIAWLTPRAREALDEFERKAMVALPSSAFCCPEWVQGFLVRKELRCLRRVDIGYSARCFTLTQEGRFLLCTKEYSPRDFTYATSNEVATAYANYGTFSGDFALKELVDRLQGILDHPIPSKGPY